MSNAAVTPEDAIIVSTTRVACDGGGGALGHPKTWLDMGQGTQVECKYCDQLFVLAPNAEPAGH
ncbi:MAG: zinc-finger domain-containing protein [Alphaproteobacteria bacterium]